MTEYILLITIVFASGLIQGLTGFGSVLFALAILGAVLDIKTIIPFAALMGFFITIIIFWGLRKKFELQALIPLVIRALPGIFIGGYFRFLDHSGYL